MSEQGIELTSEWVEQAFKSMFSVTGGQAIPQIEIYPDYRFWSDHFVNSLDDLGVKFTVHEYDEVLDVPLSVEVHDTVEFVLHPEALRDWRQDAYWASDAYRVAGRGL